MVNGWSKEKWNQYMKDRRKNETSEQRELRLSKMRAYKQTDHYRELSRKYKKLPHVIEREKKWRKINRKPQTIEQKLQKKLYDRQYHSRPEVNSKRKIQTLQYRNKPENKIKSSNYNKQYRKDPIVQEKHRIETREWHKRHPEYNLRSNLKQATKIGGVLNLEPYEYKFALISWSKSVKKRDNNQCQVCFKPAVHSHHIFYKSKYPKLSLNINNGISLCKEHHMQVHMIDRKV